VDRPAAEVPHHAQCGDQDRSGDLLVPEGVPRHHRGVTSAGFPLTKPSRFHPVAEHALFLICVTESIKVPEQPGR